MFKSMFNSYITKNKAFFYILVAISILFQLSCSAYDEPSIICSDCLDPSDGFSVVIYGDSRTNHIVHQDVVYAIERVNPVAVFHTGDIVDKSDNLYEWLAFEDVVYDLVKTAKFCPALGNHDTHSEMFFNIFNFPGSEGFYSLDVGTIHFIVLDTNSDIGVGSGQYTWLENDLQNIPTGTEFIAAIFHHPPFSSGIHIEDEKGLRSTIVPLFETYGVDLAFSGHEHNYERSYYNSIYYIVTGGGGAPLYEKTRVNPYSQLFVEEYHFCKLSIEGNQLIVEVFNADLNQIDKFTIN